MSLIDLYFTTTPTALNIGSDTIDIRIGSLLTGGAAGPDRQLEVYEIWAADPLPLLRTWQCTNTDFPDLITTGTLGYPNLATGVYTLTSVDSQGRPTGWTSTYVDGIVTTTFTVTVTFGSTNTLSISMSPMLASSDISQLTASSAATQMLAAAQTSAASLYMPLRSVRNDTSTAYTLVLADSAYIVTLNNASAVTVTIPQNSSVALPVGSEVIITGIGVGLVTVAAGSGATINNPTGASLTLARYQVARLVKIATNTWEVNKGSRPPDGTTLVVNASGQLAFAPTADVAIGSHKLTGLTGGATTGDATTFEQTVQLTEKADTSTAYTFVAADAIAKMVTLTNASATTATVPPNASVAFPIGTILNLVQLGAGQVTITPGAAVSISGTPGLKLRARYSAATLWKQGTDTWYAMGDLSA